MYSSRSSATGRSHAVIGATSFRIAASVRSHASRSSCSALSASVSVDSAPLRQRSKTGMTTSSITGSIMASTAAA